jgi:O-antigen/teichoic acid export membrane protein
VLSLLIILLAAATHAPLWAYVTAPSAGSILALAAAWPMASSTSGISLLETLRSVVGRGRPGGRVAYLAGPMTVITVAMPIAYQSDRLLLSHLSDLGQVAIYARWGRSFTGPCSGWSGPQG